jgi:hypothetical protein
MTREEILAMNPGRELDALMAEHVMGFKREKTPKDFDGNFGGEDILIPPGLDHNNWVYPPKGKIALTYHVPQYSTDWNFAIQYFSGLFLTALNNGKWVCGRANHIYDIKITDDHYQDKELVIAATPMEAICKMRLILAICPKEAVNTNA